MTDPRSRFFRNAFNSHEVGCLRDGCSWKGAYESRTAHMEDDCPGRVGPWCSFCDVPMAFSETAAHERICPRRSVLCDHCGETYPHNESQRHVTMVQIPQCELNALRELKEKVDPMIPNEISL